MSYHLIQLVHSWGYPMIAHTWTEWRTWGGTEAVWAAGTHHGAPSGDCQPAGPACRRSLAAGRRAPRCAAATVASPDWRKGRRQTGCSRLRAGTSFQASEDRSWQKQEKNFPLLSRQPVSVASVILGWKTPRKSKDWCLGDTGLLSFIYPSCPPAPLAAIYTSWAHGCLWACNSEVRNALHLISGLKTAHGHILFGFGCNVFMPRLYPCKCRYRFMP